MPSSEYYKLLKEMQPLFDERLTVELYDKLKTIGVIRDSEEYTVDPDLNLFFKMGFFEVGVSVASVEYSK